MRLRSKRRMIIYSLIGVLMFTTVAYAIIQSTLDIAGTVVKQGNVWNIYFSNLSKPNTVGGGTGSKGQYRQRHLSLK